MIKKIGVVLVSIIIFLAVYRAWFSFRVISAGDAGFFFGETINDFRFFPYLWQSGRLGQYSGLLYPFFYISLPVKVLSSLGLRWPVVERLIWYWPFLVLSLFSTAFFVKTVNPKNGFKFLAPLIYLLNSYVLMIIGGGQISIALAYSVFPLVVALFVRNILHPEKKILIVSGLGLALQFTLEPRIALLALTVSLFYAALDFRLNLIKYLKVFAIPLLVVFGVNSYWLLPLILLAKGSYDPVLASFGWVEFLSFADFPKALSLLHPNWPENLFGKTYFMRPEFLVLPILAFSSLFFVRTKANQESVLKNRQILFFALLALMGTFLAKGINPPLGGVNRWIFENLPGMNLFRDPTKFYVLIALSYSFLIPLSISEIYRRLGKAGKTFLLLVVFCLLSMIKPALWGQLGGTFKVRSVPKDYLLLKDFLNDQNDFFRTFWIPRKQRFGFNSANHPALMAQEYVTDSVCQEPLCSLGGNMSEEWGKNCLPNDRCYVRELSYFLNPKTKEVLQQMAVKYVIIPFDSEGEIFIAERQYYSPQREETEKFLDTISWLRKISLTDKIAIYEIFGPKDHFFISEPGANQIKSWQMISPTKYLVNLKIDQLPGKLIFSETYDSLWQAKIGKEILFSQKEGIFNGFVLNRQGNYQLVVEFTPQKYACWGAIVSLMTLSLIDRYLLFGRIWQTKT